MVVKIDFKPIAPTSDSASQIDFKPLQSSAPENPGLPSKIWEALTVPEKKSREGLQMLTEKLTPSMQDIEAGKANVPGMAARAGMEALTQVAPSFVSRGSILTSGALAGLKAASPVVAPIVKSGLKGLGNQLESASGISPKDSLLAAYNNAKTMFAKGTGAAKPLYEAAKNEIPAGTNIFQGMWKPEEIVSKAQEVLGKNGTLEPSEGLIARKAVDSLLKSKRYVKDTLLELRDSFDQIAKQSPNIAEADPTFIAGLRAQALRQLLPQNKLGGASPFKVAVGKALGLASAPVLSPAIQGTAATVAGLAGRYGVEPLVANPELGTALNAIFGKKKE